MENFETSLKARLQAIVGKDSFHGGDVHIFLKGGKDYWAIVKAVESDFFVIEVSHMFDGKQDIAVRFTDVAAFSLPKVTRK